MTDTRGLIYVVDDDVSVREAVKSLIRSVGMRAETFASAQEFLAKSRSEAPSCLVLDVEMPGLNGLDLQAELAKADVQIPIIFLTGHGNIPMTVRAIKAGALEFLTKPFDDEDLLGAIRQCIERYDTGRRPQQLEQHTFEGITNTSVAPKTPFKQVERVAPTESAASELKDNEDNVDLEQEIRGDMDFEQIVGNSSTLKDVLDLVQIVAPNDSTALLLGETGTGKELIARAIHDRSRRKDRAFVKLNCAAIPTGLLESELFGHERGAFTGAVTQKIGRLELADQGTLFLDEVGDIPIEIQPKLLRALQEREFERLGSTHTRKVNVRMIAATNRDLEKMIADEEFRRDLYYRLNVFPIRIPPLRERREDIPLLVSYFVERFAKQMQKRIDSIPAAAMKGLAAWDWPGNIRELENLIERAVILTRGRLLVAPLEEFRKTRKGEPPPADLHEAREIAGSSTNASCDESDFTGEYARKQREAIVRALTESKGRVGGPKGAAARLSMNRTTLLARMKKIGVDRRQYT